MPPKDLKFQKWVEVRLYSTGFDAAGDLTSVKVSRVWDLNDGTPGGATLAQHRDTVDIFPNLSDVQKAQVKALYTAIKTLAEAAP